MEDRKNAELDKFETYEDYLDSQVSEKDMYYLQDQTLARQLVELGYRGSGEAIPREEFERRKKEIEQIRIDSLTKKTQVLGSAGKNLDDYPLLKALADRESQVAAGKLTTIIFIRDKNSKGQEISGYIDYAHRLETDNFELYFERKRLLLPRPSDLSFYNWSSQQSTSNPSKYFQVIPDGELGLLFKNKRDRKVINVDPDSDCGDNSERHELKTTRYAQVVLYDHMTRRKS